tara:strand:- start:13289 stop:14455 length:1167 start_codon:yes stop_codon:yes gene_type:complete
MAVSFITSPYQITPSDNPVRWTFASNQTGQANFSFIVEVYVNGVLDSRREVFPEVGSRAHIDISDIMMRVTPLPSTTHTTVVKNSGNYTPCYIKVRERYGSTPAYQADATSSTVNCFKASITKKDFTVYNPSIYEIGQPISLFMNYAPNTLRLNHDSNNIVTVFNVLLNDLTIVFTLYDSTGSSITSADISIPDTNLISQINLRSSLLIAETPITLALFNQASYLEYYCEQYGGDQVSEIKRVYFDQSECGIRTHCVWLNKLGSFDCYTFTHNKIVSAKIESSTFERQFGAWVGNLFSYNANGSGVVDFLKQTKSMIQVVSGFIQQDMQNFLVQNMYTSPLVYVSDGSTYEQMRIEATEYELQNDDFEEDFTEVVTLAFPNIDYSQVL